MPVSRPFSFFIQWHLTERCNLACTHCYQQGTSKDEMELGEIEGVMADVRDMLRSWSDAYGIEFLPSMNITGGEPFLRKDLFSILERAHASGFESYLLTNGTLIDREKARALSGLGVKSVQVSLEGPEKVHEAIRGKGSYGQALAGVALLRDEGMPVTLNVTLSKINADHFMELIDIATRLDVNALGFSRLVPAGRGMGLLDAMIGKEALKTLYKEVFSHAGGSLELVTGDPVASQMSGPPVAEDGGDIPGGGCAAGVSGLTFLPDGTVTPCRRLPIPIGNVRTDSLREIWATSGVLEKLRSRNAYKGKCRVCAQWSSCRGCRAIAYAYSLARGEGDLLAEDPQCFIVNRET